MTRTMSVVILAVALVLMPVSAEARRPTFATHDCTGAKIRPRQIVFACADGGYFVNHLGWKFWHRRKAVARGIFHRNDCEPSCAGGTFHKRRGKLIVSGRRWCKNIDQFVFRRARAVYDRPLLGRRRDSAQLFCPL